MKYLVHFRRNTHRPVNPAALQQEQQRTAILMRDNILKQIYMNKQMDQLWMEIHTENEHDLMEIISTLPMSKELFFEVHSIL
jgi:hypothetical protein